MYKLPWSKLHPKGNQRQSLYRKGYSRQDYSKSRLQGTQWVQGR
jgi:hypothetical protein